MISLLWYRLKFASNQLFSTRIPLSPGKSRQPNSLPICVVNNTRLFYFRPQKNTDLLWVSMIYGPLIMVYKLRLKNRGLKNAPKAACSWKYEICVIWSVWWSWAEWRDLATHPAVTNHLIPPSFYFCRRFFHRSDSNWKIGENLKNGRKRNMMRVYCRFEWLIIF